MSELKVPEVYVHTPWYVTLCTMFPILNFMLSRRVNLEVDCEPLGDDPFVMELKARVRLPRWFKPKFIDVRFKPVEETSSNVRVRILDKDRKVEYVRSLDKESLCDMNGNKVNDVLDPEQWYTVRLDERDSTNPRLI